MIEVFGVIICIWYRLKVWCHRKLSKICLRKWYPGKAQYFHRFPCFRVKNFPIRLWNHSSIFYLLMQFFRSRVRTIYAYFIQCLCGWRHCPQQQDNGNAKPHQRDGSSLLPVVETYCIWGILQCELLLNAGFSTIKCDGRRELRWESWHPLKVSLSLQMIFAPH